MRKEVRGWAFGVGIGNGVVYLYLGKGGCIPLDTCTKGKSISIIYCTLGDLAVEVSTHSR